MTGHEKGNLMETQVGELRPTPPIERTSDAAAHPRLPSSQVGT